MFTRCVKNSFSASLLSCIEAYIHKLTRIYEGNVDLFICPSNFMYKKMIEFGIDKEKMVVIPNGIEMNEYEACYSFSDYILYYGRIEKEKGISTLINAAEKIRNLNFCIIGNLAA